MPYHGSVNREAHEVWVESIESCGYRSAYETVLRTLFG